MRSIGVRRAEMQGMWQPICARITAIHVMRSTVDLPAAFAPVRRSMFGAQPPSLMSFGIKLSTVVSMHGWRSSSNSMTVRLSLTKVGRQLGCPRLCEDLARLIRQSSWAMILTAASQTL